MYFTKASIPLFNRSNELKFATDEIVKTSPAGVRYIEDTDLSQNIKDAFKNNSFVKNLAEKFDTFVWFDKIQNEGAKFFFTAKVSWADFSKTRAQSETAFAKGDISEADTLNELLLKISNQDFI